MALTDDERNLLKGCRLGEVEVVRSLLAAGMSPNIRDAAGRSAISKALHFGHPAIIRMLIEAGADATEVASDWTAQEILSPGSTTIDTSDNELVDLMYIRSCEILAGLEKEVRDDVYVLSFYIEDNAGAQELQLDLGYNTQSRWRACTPTPGQEPRWPIASSSNEAKWNCAFWLQERYEPVFGASDEDWRRRQGWLQRNGLFWTREEEDADFERTHALSIRAQSRFWTLVTEVALRLRENGLILNTFRRDLPLIIHEVHQDESCIEPTKRANPDGQAEAFFTEQGC